MAWVQWVDGKVVGNAIFGVKGVGDNWREVVIESIDPTSDKVAQIVEEDGVLYRRGVEVTLSY